jgi:hypothetical protein
MYLRGIYIYLFNGDKYLVSTPWGRFLEKLTIALLFRKFPAFYGTQCSIILLTEACKWPVSWAISVKFTHTLYFYNIHVNTVHTYTSGFLHVASFIQEFPLNFCMYFLTLTQTHAPVISSPLKLL